MAKDNREIIHGISIMQAREGKKLPKMKVLASGMEDELAAAFSQQELDAMKERGDITGTWKSTQGAATGGASSSKKSAETK